VSEPDAAGDDRAPIVPLAAVELVRVRLPLRRSLQSGHGVEEVREVVLVRAVAADGVEGWGECSALERPTYTAEYTDGAWAMLRDVLVPAHLGRGDVGSGEVVGHPFASAALRDAELDIRLRRDGHSLASSFGAEPDWGLAWTAVLGIPDGDQLESGVVEARGRGASAVKVKVRPSGNQGWATRLRAAHPDLVVAVDANGGFRGWEHQLVDLAEVLASAEVDPVDAGRVYVEQPLPPDDLVATAALAPRLAVPVALDESVTRSGDVAAAWALGAAALVNLKPGRAGGAIAALGFLDRRRTPIRMWSPSRPPTPYPDPDIERHPWVGPSAFLGGMLETGVGRATALGVGVALGLAHTDLGPSSWYFDDDVTEPIELGADGRMRPPPGPGIGVTPRPERLAEVAVDRLLIRR
jgi:O-succinylbenzoate synthase